MASWWKVERTKDPMVYILRYVFLLLFFVRHIFKMAIFVFHERLIWVLLLLYVLSIFVVFYPWLSVFYLFVNMCKSFFATNFKIGLEWGAINVQLSQFSGANALFQIDAGKQNSHLFLI